MKAKQGVVLGLSLGLMACGGGSGSESGGGSTAPVTYTVTASAGVGGTITPGSAVVNSGATTSFTVIANSGFTIASITGCAGTLSGSVYTTGTINAACTVSATFNQTVTDNAAPSAKIGYPWRVSRIVDDSVLVSGTASDASGIKSVRVNGVAATLSTIPATAKPHQSGAFNKNEQSVSWSAVVPLPSQKDVQLTVQVEDTKGNTDNTADTVTVNTRNVPVSFALDRAGERLIGRNDLSDLTVLGLRNATVSDLIIDNAPPGGLAQYVPSRDAVLYVSISGGSNLLITSISTTTGTATTLANQPLSFDSANFNFIAHTDVSYSASENALYVMAKHFSKTDSALNKNVIYRHDLSSAQTTTIIDGTVGTGEKLQSSVMKVASDGILVLNSEFGGLDDGISKIKLDGSEISAVSTAASIQPTKMILDEPNNAAYLVGFSSVARVALDTGAITLLQDFNPSVFIEQIVAADIDISGNRVLFGDQGIDIITAVDLTTGKRSVAVSNGIGTGRNLMVPRGLYVDEANNVAYVADDGGNTPDVLFQVDLDTGNRTTMSNLSSYGSTNIQDLVMDEQNQKLYVIASNQIISYDINAMLMEVIASDSIGSGPSFGLLTGGDFDVVNGRLLVTDSQNSTLLAVELATGNRVVLSGLNEKGTGDTFGSAVDVKIDQRNQNIYVASSSVSALFKVNAATGDREVVLTECNTSGGVNYLSPSQSGARSLFIDEESDEILINTSWVLRYNLALNECEPVGFNGANIPDTVLDIAKLSTGQVIATRKNALVQVDLTTGKHAVISK